MRREKLVVLGQLTAGIGHELRAPLGIISNAVVLLDMLLPDADSEVRECLSIICNQVHRSDKIISDLLSFSRPRLADSLQQEHVAVPDLVKEVLQQVPPPENVEVRTRLDPDLPLLLIDRQQISQALINLTTNAYQAMPNGGRLTFSAGSNTHGVVVSVKDTGCGISPQHRQRLFEPLFTTKPKGIGLGLAVTRDLIQANRGTISVRSEEGVGSEFIIKLPLD